MKKLLIAASLLVVAIYSASAKKAKKEEKKESSPNSVVVKEVSKHNLEDTVRDEDDSMRSAESGFAEEEFRRGVQSYYRGNYNEAILEFEKALSYLPGENRILEWLGKAYYMSGVEGTAIQEWQFASSQGWGGLVLANKIEVVGERRITDRDYGFTQRYTESGSFPNVNGSNVIYHYPISSLPNDDGSFWIVAYGSNEILKFSVNGVVMERVRGPLEGFDRPVDIVRLSNGNLLVTESEGNRLSLLDPNGKFISHYGKKGRGVGELIGPQYAAEDDWGNIYVSDYGNNRIVVFDPDGNGLFAFGSKDDNFKGLKSPTGIAIIEDRVFVADSYREAVYEFDRSGNYRGVLVEEGSLKKPEGMRKWGDYLVLADMNRVLAIDISTGALFENATTGNASSCITSAVPDRNGNIVVTDFKANEIYVMSKMSELIGGFFVQIEKVNSDSFPNVTLEVKIENRKRQPIVGLDQSNFLVTENKYPVMNMTLEGVANKNDFADVTFLIDRSYDMRNYEEQVNTAVREVCASMDGKGKVQIMSLGDVPVLEFSGNSSDLSSFSVRALKSSYTAVAPLDLGLRLSANSLINAEKKRAIIYITSGNVSQTAFTKYSLSDLSAYINNNAISLNTIVMNNTAPAPEITYLTDNTSGETYYVYRPEGLGGVMSDIISIPSGMYKLSYTSSLGMEYGRKYLPVEVEAYLLNRSGRDETGYFAPLQ